MELTNRLVSQYPTYRYRLQYQALGAKTLADLGPARTRREAERNVVLTCKLVSSELGNTPAVCRSAYIHPVVLEHYLKGKTIAPLMRKEDRKKERESSGKYYPEEAALMRFLDSGRS
mgnify:CR=1 FL=1